MAGIANTTIGPVSVDALGFTLIHEHVAIFSPGVREAYPHLYNRRTIREACIDALRAARDVGVRTIVDLTTPDLGRDPRLVADVAEIAEIYVVLCTGIWLDVPRYLRARSVEFAAKLFVREIEQGIGRTGIRAGIIKVASGEVVTVDQEKILRAAARASRTTGAAISTHTLASFRTGLRQLEILDEEGVSPERIIIGHSTECDANYLARLYAAGVAVGWDQFGTNQVQDEEGAIMNLVHVLGEGRGPQTLVSMDNAAFVDWEPNHQGSFGYLSGKILPRLRSEGVSEEVIRGMTVDGPARLLAIG
jgi:phosphotriesterase-related protein